MPDKLRLGFDARLLAHESTPTGVGQYARELLKGLAAVPNLSVRLYSDQPIPGTEPGQARVLRRIPGVPWQQSVLTWDLSRRPVDVYHAPTFSIPLRSPVPTVVTIHDLSFERYPQYVRPQTRRYLRRMVPLAVRRADRIITPSRAVANEIVEQYHLSEDVARRIRPVPLGLDLKRWTPKTPSLVRDWQRHAGLASPYLLFVGTREPRKNLVRLVKAFQRARPSLPGLELVLAGPPGFDDDELDRVIAEVPGVRVLAYVSQADLPLLVQGALGLCYVSEYEGFGLPVLEAMAMGTPILTSVGTVMEEIAGPMVLYAVPQDEEDIRRGIIRLVEEAEVLLTQRHDRITAAHRYTWAETARKTAAVYRELM